MEGEKKPLSPVGNSGHSAMVEGIFSAAAGGPAGTRLHARQDKPLVLVEIDARILEHGIGLLLQKYFEPCYFEGHIALLGGFGYVHSQ